MPRKVGQTTPTINTTREVDVEDDFDLEVEQDAQEFARLAVAPQYGMHAKELSSDDAYFN